MYSFNKNIHLLVIDLETLGLKPGCMVTELGASLYSTNHREVGCFDYHQPVDFAGSKRAGFRLDKKTMNWWAGQLGLDPSLKKRQLEEVFASKWRNTMSVRKTIQDFSAYVRAVQSHIPEGEKLLIVGNDIDFDKSILEAYYAAFQIDPPWHYRDWISLPTVVWLVEVLTGVNVKTKVRETWQTTHDALDDARQETAMLSMALDLVSTMSFNERVSEENGGE